jgi:hypothetical protein
MSAKCKNCDETIQKDIYGPDFLSGWVHVNGCVVTSHCVDRRKGMRRAPLETVAETA